MSVSSRHPDPNCPACHGAGRVPFGMDEDDPQAFVPLDYEPNLRPCARCKARECDWCDAVFPAHEPGCAKATLAQHAPSTTTERDAARFEAHQLRDRIDSLRAIHKQVQAELEDTLGAATMLTESVLWLRAALRALADRNPYAYDSSGSRWCAHCGSSSRAQLHDPTCPWRRARELAGT